MSRLSFSHVLLASFFLIAAILGSAAVSGLIALETFAERSRAGANHALRSTAAVQQLAERSVDMQRAARQYRVLEDAELLERFALARRDAEVALERIETLGLPHVGTLVESWRDAALAATEALAVESDGEDQLTSALERLTPINEQLATAVRVQIGRDSQQRLDELDANRVMLGWHVTLAFIAAGLLAALTGWWILRPLRRVERAIDALGESRLAETVSISGPADLRRIGRRLDWLRQRLAELEANRARVLRHVSHELKTPLASLREGIALLDDRVVGGLNAGQREVVSILENSARILQQRIEGLLGYNAAVFDAHTLRRRPVSLRALIDQVVASQQLQIQGRGLRVLVEGDVPNLAADADKLEIVFANLVANAVSFSPDGGALRIVLSTDAERARVDLIDEGPGIPADEAERVFEPFFQGRDQPTVDRNGSGLDLSIVREFVQAHGGTVTLQKRNKGAHFTVELAYEN